MQDESMVKWDTCGKQSTLQ